MYSAWLANWVSPLTNELSLPTAILRPTVPSLTGGSTGVGANEWTGVEERLRAVAERLQQQLAKEGVSYPRSFGLTRAGASLPKSRYRVSSNSKKVASSAKTVIVSTSGEEIVAERL